MPYHPKVIEKIKSQPLTLGTRLGRWAVYLDLPAVKIALAVGATRQSVYNWMKGGEVFVAYRPAVERVLQCMQSSQTAEEAWRKICTEFDLRS
jgi:hypothetical protein